MRIILTRSGIWALEYDDRRRVQPGNIVKDNNDIPAMFQGIADGHVELSEFDDPRAVQGIQRVPIGEFLDKYTADDERLGQAGPIGIVRDHPSHGEDKTSQGKSVIDRGSREIEWRWAKEAIGLTTVELNEAYAQFEITRDGCNIPSPHLHRASARLLEVMKRLGLAEYRKLDDEIPF